MYASNHSNHTNSPILFQNGPDFYCIKPNIQNHVNQSATDAETSNEILTEQNGEEISKTNPFRISAIRRFNKKLSRINGSKTNRQESITLSRLDPYIDAVKVKNRINNKPGVRVKAAGQNSSTSLITLDRKARDSSSYARTIHVEESVVDNDEWEHSSGESDSDNDDEYDSESDGRHRKKLRPKKRKNKIVRVYGPHRSGKKKGRGKKVVYISGAIKHYDDNGSKYQSEHKDFQNYGRDYRVGHKSKHHRNGTDKKHHRGHHHKSHHQGKLIHLNLLGKAKTSLAGVLGFTLLCVNYLLILKQPTYDKYSGHFYTRYMPHGGHGDTVELKSGGPVLLAHCSDLDEVRSLVEIDQLSKTLSSEQKTAKRMPRMTYDPSFTGFSEANKNDVTKSELNEKTNSRQTMMMAEQQQSGRAHLSPDTDRLELFGAPNHFYTTAPDENDDQSLTRHRDAYNRGILAPLQVALNRLLAASRPTTRNNIDPQRVNQPSDDIQLIDLFREARIHENGRQVSDSDNRNPASLLDNGDRRVALVANERPRLIQTLDNLIQMQTRPIGIGIRIVDGRRGSFGFSPQVVDLNSGNREVQLNISEQFQNDEPISGGTSTRIVDIPEFALAGDTIELTCNHRLTTKQLYAVKWFKDSLEFYRFVPADEPRSKTTFLMPDIDLDLARSGWLRIVLRNVTHRASGLYRCEAVSEAPNFELMTGERLMRVYELPDIGPQLVVLERNFETRDQLAINTPGDRRPMFLGEREENNWPPRSRTLNNNTNGRNTNSRQAQRQMIAGSTGVTTGRLIRCSSARSNPVAQLRFFINNKPVPFTRTVENSTLRYSDGLESNVVAIRLQLGDFMLDTDNSFVGSTDSNENNGNNNPPLDRAASLKSLPKDDAADIKKSNGRMQTQKTATTMSPKAAIRGNSKKTPKIEEDENPNANVRFDDSESDAAKLKTKDIKKKNKSSKKTKTKPMESGGKTRGAGQNKKSAGKANVSEQTKEEHSVANNKNQEDPGKAIQVHGHKIDSSMPYPDELKSPHLTESKEQQFGSKQSLNALAVRSQKEYADITSNSSSSILGDESRPSSRVIEFELSNLEQRQQPQRRAFSNSIRLKCASLVPTLNYEMISELNIPLGLLVPANQLSEAVRQSNGTRNDASPGDNQQDDDSDDTRAPSRRSDEDAGDDDVSPTVRTNRGNDGGSPQAFRADLIDRLPQATWQPVSIHPTWRDSFGNVQKMSSSAKSNYGTTNQQLFVCMLSTLAICISSVLIRGNIQ